MSTGAPNEKGVAIRLPAQSLLCIDSEDANRYNDQGYRFGDNTPANIQVNRQQPLLFGYMTRLQLTEIQVFWNTPNVNRQNYTFTYEVFRASTGASIGVYRVIVPEGWYGGTELAAALQTALRAQAVTDSTVPVTETINWSVTFTNNTSSAEPMTFQIICAVGNTSGNGYRFRIVPFTKYYPLVNLGAGVPAGIPVDDLTYMMGLIPSDYFQTTTTSLGIRGGLATLQYTPYFDICSNILTKNQNVADGDTAVTFYKKNRSKLARVYLNNSQIQPMDDHTYSGSPPSIQFVSNIPGVRPFAFVKEFNTPKTIMWNTTENVDVIDLELLDHRGNPLYISPLAQQLSPLNYVIEGNNANFQFTIMASET